MSHFNQPQPGLSPSPSFDSIRRYRDDDRPELYGPGPLSPPPRGPQGPHYGGSPSAASSSENVNTFPPTPNASRGMYLSPLAAASATADDPRTSAYARHSYADLTQPSAWLEKQQRQGKFSRRFVYAILIFFAVLIIVGATVGGIVASRKKGGDDVAAASNPTQTSGAVIQQDPNDPSKFDKDPRLHNSFYGFAYTPKNALMPDCGAALAPVIEDIQLLSQLTTRLRLYGADCNITALVLEAIRLTKVDLNVYLGIYVLPNDTTGFNRQLNAVQAAITTYGTDHIEAVTVGNEFMLNYLTEAGETDPEGAAGLRASTELRSRITATRNMLSSLNLSKNIPVGSSDAGSYFNRDLLRAIDYGMSNIHAWFASVTIAQAANWTFNFFDEQNVQPAQALSNRPDMYIAETGWPTKSSDAQHATNGASPASEAGLQTFMDDFVCQANQQGVKYFFFEFTDEEWKDRQFGGVEGWWGIFNGNKTLKNVVLPNCSHP